MSTHIVKIQNEAIFSPSELRYIKAYDNVQVKDKNRLDVILFISDLIVKTYYSLGQKKDNDKEIELLAENLVNDLNKYHSTMTLEEIDLSFEFGVRKEYGEYYGLNLVTFDVWLKGFKMDQRRVHAFQKKINHLKAPDHIPTYEEKEKIHKRSIELCFNDYKENGILSKYKGYDSLTCYEILKESGYLTITREQSWQIFEKATNSVKSDLSSKKIKHIGDAILVQQITSEQELIESNKNQQVINESRKIALSIYFDSLIYQGKHINDIIKTLKFE